MKEYNYFSFLGENSPSLILLGGKAMNLFKLYENNIRIPSCFALNSRVYRETISKLDISEMIESFFSEKSPHKKVVNFSNNIKTKIHNCKLPKDVFFELKQAIKRLKEKIGEDISLAVRSSANIEDQAQFSFAGQAESFLFNNTVPQIVKSIKKCWASLFSPQNLLYFLKSKQRGYNLLSIDMIDMAVIIQQMIDSDIAGVLFTVNVLNSNAKQMLINSNWGLCESITKNSVIPDLIILEKKKFRLIEFKVGNKEYRCIKNPNGPYTINVKNEPEKQEKFSLNDYQLQKIYELGLKIEKIFNYPQDIEWAFQNDLLYTLQSRPITNLSLNK